MPVLSDNRPLAPAAGFEFPISQPDNIKFIMYLSIQKKTIKEKGLVIAYILKSLKSLLLLWLNEFLSYSDTLQRIILDYLTDLMPKYAKNTYRT